MSVTITGLEQTMRNLSPQQIRAPKRRFLTRIALIGERNVKRHAPVRTGHFRRSITHKVEENRAIIGSNVKYGPYLEYGTRFMRARAPFERGIQASQGAIRGEVSRFSRELAGKLGGS
jgi:phage gpG-like protein